VAAVHSLDFHRTRHTELKQAGNLSAKIAHNAARHETSPPPLHQDNQDVHAGKHSPGYFKNIVFDKFPRRGETSFLHKLKIVSKEKIQFDLPFVPKYFWSTQNRPQGVSN
jgi:hypothetical protein